MELTALEVSERILTGIADLLLGAMLTMFYPNYFGSRVRLPGNTKYLCVHNVAKIDHEVMVRRLLDHCPESLLRRSTDICVNNHGGQRVSGFDVHVY